MTLSPLAGAEPGFWALRLAQYEVVASTYLSASQNEAARDTGHYGPYAPNLNKVLEVMEGHFIRGYGDRRKPDAEIGLLPGAVEEASNFLTDKSESRARLDRVSRLIEGFETPYGMELLATVHWLAHKGGPNGSPPADNPESAIAGMRDWNPHKATTFKPEHVPAAWKQLGQNGWLR